MNKNIRIIITYAIVALSIQLTPSVELLSAESKSYIIKYNGNLEQRFAGVNFDFEVSKVFRDEMVNSEKISDQLLSSEAQNLLKMLGNYYEVKIKTSEIDKLNELFQNDESLISITPNHIYSINNVAKTNDSLFSQQWNLKQVNALKAWAKADGNGVIVGVIDTGIDFEHPDLIGALWINSKEDINGNGRFDAWSVNEIRDGVSGDLDGIDNDGNGFIDDVIGYDFVDQDVVNFGDYRDPDPIPEDEGDHGTSVSGIISATTNNEIGIASVAPGARILTSKAFDISGNAEADDIAKAIIYAVLNGAKVLNFSFGERYESPIMYDAIKFAYNAGCVMVTSAGNTGWFGEHYPSIYPEVINVGGTNSMSGRYGRSNYGSFLDLVAPGEQVMTTVAGGDYALVSGTSIAAPHVSAVVAMLFEIDPTLRPSEIHGILAASSYDIGAEGWDVFFGSGILDAYEAVNFVGSSVFMIDSPKNETEFYTDRTPIIDIYGSVATPLFDSYVIKIGRGILPEVWTEVHTENRQKINEKLGSIDISNLMTGKYNVSLFVNLKNKKTIERRMTLNITNENDSAKFEYLNVVSAFANDKRVILIGAKTSKKGTMTLKFRADENDEYTYLKQSKHKSIYHSIEIFSGLIPGQNYQAIAEVITNSGDTLTREFEFSVENDVWTTGNFDPKPYSIHRSYINNNHFDLYGDGNPVFVVNDMSSLNIGTTKIYQYQSGQLVLRDTSAAAWIPVGMGDSNGDGIPEIFATAQFNSVSEQGNFLGDNPFAKQVFKNPIGTSFWGEQMYDLDGKGKKDLIGYRYEVENRHYLVYEHQNGEYKIKTTAELPENLRNVPITRNSAIADFDGDGNLELCIVNTNSNVLIYQYQNGEFNIEWVDSAKKSNSNQFLTSADIDGDGIPEIIHMFAESEVLFQNNEAPSNIWTARVLKSNGHNRYEEIWKEHFYGVKQGFVRTLFSYRNGISSGDLDGEPGDEIIFSPFPNLYVYRYNKQSKEFEKFWWYPSTLSNSALVADIDGNGMNEIGFTTFNSMRFFEYRKGFDGPKIPTNFKGVALDAESGKLTWDMMDDAEMYLVYQLVHDGNNVNAVLIKETTFNELIIQGLTAGGTYEFVLRSFNSTMTDKLSDYTDVAYITAIAPAKFIAAKSTDKNVLEVVFSGYLPHNHLEAGIFLLYDDADKYLTASSSTITSYDSVAIVTFPIDFAPNKNYKLIINPFLDRFDNLVNADSAFFTYTAVPVEDEMFLIKLVFLSQTLLQLEFSEPVESESSSNRSNYVMKPFGEVLFAERSNTDSTLVLLNISQSLRDRGARGFDYTISAYNINSTDGTPITKGPGNTLGFVISSDDLIDTYVFPHPIILSEEPKIFFANLTQFATVKIMSLDGVEIISLIENNGNGGVEWDGRDRQGALIPPGIYTYEVSGKNSDGIEVFTNKNKFVVLP
jgi:hypothetical protein